MIAKLLTAALAVALLAGCQEAAPDVSKEASPSIGKQEAKPATANTTKMNPAAGYPKHAAGEGDALK